MTAAAALALAACGGTTASLDDAAEATGEETSRMQVVYSVEDDGKTHQFRSSGVVDYPGGRAEATTSTAFPFYGPGVELKEIRLIGDTAYWRWAVEGETYWTKQTPVEQSGDPAELLVPGPGTPTKPTDVLTRVLLASDENAKVGSEEVRGVETTHYRARVNLDKLVKQVPERERPPGELAELWGGPIVPVDIWIDDESRLRKLVIARGGEDAMTATVELYDYGVEVDVDPPEGRLISDEEFQKLVREFEPETRIEERVEPEVCEPPKECREDRQP